MQAVGFQPTHRVVSDGANAWLTRDTTTAAHRLDPRTPVQVLAHDGTGWTQVRCDNGWEGWLAPRDLEPLNAAGSRTALWVVLAVVFVVVVIAGVAIVAKTRSSTTSAAPTTVLTLPPTTTGPAPRADATPVLNAPAGWVTSPDGKTVAKSSGDLTADPPTGPRVKVDTALPASADAVLSNLAPNQEVQVGNDPTTATVSGRKAESIGLVTTTPSGPIVQLYVFVALGKGKAATFVLEAPFGQWESVKKDLASVPALK